MQGRTLAGTGMALPRVILGCGSFGGAGSTRALWGSGADQAEAYRILDQAFELGITCLDTADAYGGGRSEEFIGGWLKTKSPADRARVLIATKVGQPVGPGPRDRGLSAAHIARQIDVSLSRLGVDAVAMYLIHHPDPDTPLAETIDALDQVVRAGKAGHLGICNVTTAQLRATVELARANGCAPVEWVQNPYNLLQREDEAHLLPYAVGTRLGYTAHSPLAGGWLTGKYQSTNSYPADSRMGQRPERYESFVDRSLPNRIIALRAHAEERGCTLPALALAWLLCAPAVTAPIVGPRRSEHLAVVAEALTLPLSEEERNQLAHDVAPHSPKPSAQEHR